MASKRSPWIIKTFRTYGRGKVTRLLKRGWTIVTETPHGIGGVVTVTMSKPDPRF